MWNRKCEYLKPKICFMNCLRTYISKKSYVSGKKNPIKYDVVRTIIYDYTLQKELIFLDIF